MLSNQIDTGTSMKDESRGDSLKHVGRFSTWGDSSLKNKWILGSILVVSLALIGFVIWVNNQLNVSQRAMRHHQYSQARTAAERYLLLSPNDSDALMLAGDAYFLDDSLDPVEAAEGAIRHYSKISDESPLAATALSKQGRAAFLVLQEPSRAERIFLKAIKLDADQYDAHYLLWQLKNMTERYFDSEQHFRAVYRLCPPSERAHRLREWYFSQFSPLSACGQLDLMMRFRTSSELPAEEVAFRRLSAFLKYEPREYNTSAAIAQWHLRNQSRETALVELEKVRSNETANDRQDPTPFYTATLVETLIELGQIERAKQEFSQWDGPNEGYLYHRIAGIYAQEVDGNLELATQQLEKATQAWPGPSDWLLMNRLSRCLALSGNKEESNRIREEAKRVEALTDIAVHQAVRQSLGNLADVRELEAVAKFYDSLGRTWEANEWREIIASTTPAKR